MTTKDAERATLDREPTISNLLSYIHGDWVASGHAWTKPGLHAMVVYRFGRWADRQEKMLRTLLMIPYRLGFWWVRNFYGIELFFSANVGRRFHIAHQSAIVIHPFATIGDDCIVRQGVTLGTAMNKHFDEAPTLGNRVDVGAGAAICGQITIGDGVRVGPNAVVLVNVPAGATVVAPPARVIPAPSAQPVAVEVAV